MYWVNILQFWQPCTIERETLDVVVEESYLPLINTLKKNPRAKLTLNINAGLIKSLFESGYQGLINDLSNLIKRKQIEVTGSSAYHCLLPLLPEKEIIRQIKLNQEINQQYLGKCYRPTGFFPPEMAYNNKVGKIIKKLGFKWVVLDELSYNGKLGQVEYQTKYKIKDLNLIFIPRQRKASKSYVPYTVRDLLAETNPPSILITGTDSELYGHRHQDQENVFNKLVKNQKLKMITVSQLIKLYKKTKTLEVLPSTWDTLPQEMQRKAYFSLWYSRKNKIQQWLWQLTYLALELTDKHQKDVNYYWSRLHLDRGMTSCTYWWASGRDFRLFGPPAWHPEQIERGAMELIKSIRSLESVSPRTKLKAEKIYQKIIKRIWNLHWEKYA